jgi:membrane-associated phospholipid phosphatase
MSPRPITAAAGGVSAFVGLALLVATDRSDAFDRGVIGAVRDPAIHDSLSFLAPVTELGGTWAVTVIALLVAFLGVAVGPWRHGIIGAVVIGVASLGVEAFKAFLARERPDVLEPIIVEHGFSFPSGHATLSMVAYGVLAVLVTRSFVVPLVERLIVAIAVTLVFLIGLSRVWLGVHYPTDVIAGWIAGALIVAAYAWLTREVSREPAAVAVDEDPAARRSGPPAAG